jgi:hypothetical protein
MRSRAKEIAEQLSNADKRALLAKPGSGAFSSAAFKRLMDNKLMDGNFWPTELGWEVRIELGGSSS